MKRILNPFSVRSVVPLALAAMLVTFPTGTQPKVASVSAAPTTKAKAEFLFKDEAVRDAGVNEAMLSLPFTNPNSPLRLGGTAPDKNDTPEGMMAVAKEGLATTRDATAALNDLTTLLNRLSTDKGYATKLLDAVKKGDSNAVTSVLKETMTRSDFTVRNIKYDFHIEMHLYTNKSHQGEFTFCISSDNSCDGHNITLG